jgi:hypothetical protein
MNHELPKINNKRPIKTEKLAHVHPDWKMTPFCPIYTRTTVIAYSI